MTSVAAEYDHMEIQQQYNDGVNNRWDADDWDNENSSARLFERSRIKALAGRTPFTSLTADDDDVTPATFIKPLEIKPGTLQTADQSGSEAQSRRTVCGSSTETPESSSASALPPVSEAAAVQLEVQQRAL